jgi:hypothetical protein
MKMAKVDTEDTRKAILAFTNKEYSWAAGGVVFIDGVKGGGYCKWYELKRDEDAYFYFHFRFKHFKLLHTELHRLSSY